ncbi:2-isopropylmalate synthase [Desulfobaculum xiamenense]|uniref:Citramalate synthase n=1 Tax=Desulfobaculum xiamenense TaxID=995050 RepID=A0A846QPX5_9BACT|nr:citramalate synthase [Desulfobaculum xiamenense]NJB66749.1 2-isopropylmalate synthase [Desulfobaculum xiamenense]
MKQISIYDTTLRDGTQAEEISLSTADKIRIAGKLDALGVDYIEGGWPGSNETDRSFFQEIRQYDLSHSRIAAFGSTCNPKGRAADDANLRALVEAEPDAVTLFGKTWDLHVTEALRVSLERNLDIISDSISHMCAHAPEVFFDAEHFFDGYRKNPDYALACLRHAHEAGAKVLVLCDTNGGSLPFEVREIVQTVRAALPEAQLGIHTHNDSETAVANAVEAVFAGAVQVQGTINGFGERCGNANLCSIIPNLELKSGGRFRCLPEGRLKLLTSTSQFVSELCNLRPFMRQPYVGKSAFAHKGGVHVSAVLRNPETYEHVRPELVGNEQRVLLSDLSGRSNILFMAKKYGYALDKNDSAVLDLLDEVKTRESQGYEYSTAEASFELMFFKAMGWSKRYFHLINFNVVDSMREGFTEPYAEATVMLKVGGMVEHTAATGQGQVNALDVALRKALTPFYPTLGEMRLEDFKVRVLHGVMRDSGGTASVVRVLIESADATDRWTTVGVHYDVIHASWQALVDSINYKLFKDDPKKFPVGGKHFPQSEPK